jgi:signal peptide peptidase SppA
MRDFGQLAQRLFNVPLMIEPAKAEIVCAAMMNHLGIARFSRLDGVTLEASELRQRAEDALDGDRPQTRFYSLQDGVAIIPVAGTLVQKQAGVDPWSGMCGYNQISRKIREARADSAVRGILLEIDSPGGEVAGCFALVDEIREGRGAFGGKPIWGYANEMACSAAYAIASACDEVHMAQTAVVGSIGVWTMLAEMTRAFDKDGVNVTLRRAGERKARGGPYEAWDDATLEKIDAWLAQSWTIFVNAVVAGRPKLTANDVYALEGDWYAGEDAFETGLIDGIGPLPAVIEELRRTVAA